MRMSDWSSDVGSSDLRGLSTRVGFFNYQLRSGGCHRARERSHPPYFEPRVTDTGKAKLGALSKGPAGARLQPRFVSSTALLHIPERYAKTRHMLLLHISDIHFRAPDCMNPALDADRPYRPRMVQDARARSGE